MDTQDDNPKDPSILMIMDKWCESNITCGPAEWESNLFQSLKSTGLASKVTQFNFDDYWVKNCRRGDDELLELCLRETFSLVVLIIYREPGSHYGVLQHETLRILSKELKLPVVAIWGDIQQPVQAMLSQKLLPFVYLNACTASSSAVAQLSPRSKYLYYWVPKDPRVFHNPGKKRDILISYIGSPKPERMVAVDYLKNAGINVYVSGGERVNHLNVFEYADILQRSKITVGFSRSAGYHVTNARVFEALLCGAMLLEEEGIETPQLFRPFIDYVPYTSLDDLVSKTTHYLSDEHARTTIAENGCGRCHIRYSARAFWESILQRTHLYPVQLVSTPFL